MTNLDESDTIYDNTFTLGNQVRLHSGGPNMTVTRAADVNSQWTDKSMVECTWFDDDDQIHEHLFPVECVTHV